MQCSIWQHRDCVEIPRLGARYFLCNYCGEGYLEQGRSWSYNKLKTNPVMQLPPKKEKRVEKKGVDGVEVDVEVEVEVVEPMKRLFLFPGRETVRAR